MKNVPKDAAESSSSCNRKQSTSEPDSKKRNIFRDEPDSGSEKESLIFKPNTSTDESVTLDTPPCAQKATSPPIIISTDDDLEQVILDIENTVSLEPTGSSSDLSSKTFTDGRSMIVDSEHRSGKWLMCLKLQI